MKTPFRILRTAALGLLSMIAAAGQEPSLPRPAPEITRLSQLFKGSWRTSEQHEQSKLIPTGGLGRGTQTFRAGPGGLTIIVDNQSRNASFAFAGHGVLCWDQSERVYKSFWFDATQPAGEVQLGKWEGDNLVFQGQSDFQGERVTFRSVYTDFRPNSFTYYTEASTGTGSMKRLMTISYSRSSK
jgi:hypothetical protein